MADDDTTTDGGVAAPQEPMSEPPCSRCGYNGPGYYQPATHPCATAPQEAASRSLETETGTRLKVYASLSTKTDSLNLSIELFQFPSASAPTEAQETALQWQPIETAPKDGLIVLLAEFRSGCSSHYIGHFAFRTGPRKHWVTIPGAWERNPTHWMPLPAPPSSVSRAQED